MKNLLILAGIVLFTSCKTQLIYLSVLEPAPVTLPSYIKKVGVVDRSLPSKDAEKFDKIDKVLSLEGTNLDAEGAKSAIDGLQNELVKNNRFSEVKIISQPDLKTSGMGVFPTPLSWDKVDKICKDNKTDALFSLELFDTDTKVNYSTHPVTIKTPLGNVPGIEHEAQMVTQIKTGWRIYDPQSKNILDEIPVNESFSNYGRGINPAKAAAALTGRKEAVKDIGNKLGQNYAYRIIPYWIRVSRDYYVKGSPSLKAAKRKAQTGNWDDAARLWEKETNNSNGKIAGRACHNLAIIQEINGDLDGALKWARKAYEDYNIKISLDYIRILENRKVRNNILQEQESQ